MSNLFTREFFEVVRRRLAPDGVLAQWIQTYNFSLDEYALILRTLRSVFPYFGLVTLVEGSDTILLASGRPLIFPGETAARFQRLVDASPVVQSDLRRYFGSAQARLVLLRHYGPDQQALMKLVSPAGAQDLNTDLNMKLEFDAPLRLFDPDFSQRNLLGERLLRLRDGAWLARLMQMMAIEPQSPLGDWARGAQALAEKRLADAIAELRRAIQREPSLSVAYQDLSQALLQTKDELGAIDVMFAALPHRPDDAELRTSLGSLLSRHHRYQPAIEQLQQALRLDPNSVLVQMNLAWVLATCPDASMRDGRQAVRLAESACRTTHYEDGYCLDVLAAALAETGDFQRAVHLAAEAVARLQAEGQPSAPIEQRLALYHQGRPYREP